MLKETYGAQKTIQSPLKCLQSWLKATVCTGDAHSKKYFESSSCKTTTTLHSVLLPNRFHYTLNLTLLNKEQLCNRNFELESNFY